MAGLEGAGRCCAGCRCAEKPSRLQPLPADAAGRNAAAEGAGGREPGRCAQVRTWLAEGRRLSVPAALDAVEAALSAGGLDALQAGGVRSGDLARPRRMEIAAALNRLRDGSSAAG